ncbi:P-loop containing nucleoside triphosphate hydrolase protein [Xylaria curta]|nr:P-loop containing nucleoside triphosphate hydrolase protein [Xylaria curta]
MTERTAISFGNSNYGLEVGQNSGPIHAAFHLAPERPETPPKPSFNVPFRRDADFVARRTILDQIHEICLQPASRVALVGLGGVGKSQLAIEHAYRVRDASLRENREIWVFWVHSETRARVEEGFKSIANAVKIPGRNQPKADIPQLVYQWLQNERSGRWLMVLDSADDIDVFYNTQAMAGQRASQGEKKPLSAYLPQSSNGSIFITTRNRHLAYRLTGSYNNIIAVGPMEPKHALALLAKKSKESADTDTATRFVEALEYMPLAISQAAAYIQRRAPRTSMSKYLEEFQKSEQKRSSLLNQDSGDLRRDENAKNSVITTWQISFDHIRAKRPSAANLLCLMSFFDRQGIFEWLIRPLNQPQSSGANTDDESVSSGDSTDDVFEEDTEMLSDDTDYESVSSGYSTDNAFEEDIEMLRDYCLVQTNEKGDVFEMHGLVQLSTRKWLDADGESEKFKERFINRMAKAFPPGHFENWDTCRKLFPHAEKAIEYCPKKEESQLEWSLLLLKSSQYAQGQGRYATSEVMARMSYDTSTRVLGLEHPDTLNSMADLASTYWDQGRWKEAELLGLQVIETRKRVLGLEHPDTLTSMNNLASTYGDQGRWKEAELLGLQVIETEKRVLGLEHPDTLIGMNNLASAYWNQGRWKEAELLELQVIETRKSVLRLEHPDTLIGMNNLALTYWNQGRWKEAELLWLQVIETEKRVLGLEHPYTLSSMNNLASTYLEQGRWKKAELLGLQVIETEKRVLGLEHYHTLSSMNNLAYTWKFQGRNADAVRLMEDCVRIRRRVLGPEHPHTLLALSSLTSWREESEISRSSRFRNLKKVRNFFRREKTK